MGRLWRRAGRDLSDARGEARAVEGRRREHGHGGQRRARQGWRRDGEAGKEASGETVRGGHQGAPGDGSDHHRGREVDATRVPQLRMSEDAAVAHGPGRSQDALQRLWRAFPQGLAHERLRRRTATIGDAREPTARCAPRSEGAPATASWCRRRRGRDLTERGCPRRERRESRVRRTTSAAPRLFC